MTVLVTGGAGVIGSYVAEELLSSGQTVTIVDNFERGRKENIEAIRENERLNVVNGDLRDRAATFDVISDHSKVYHFAAKIGGVGYLRAAPADIISDNDLINKHVFDACAQGNVDRLVYAGSSMVYAEAETYPHEEEDIGVVPPPSGSYGFQKLNGEYYCTAYQRQYDLEYCIARIFNGVAPRDRPESEVGHGHVIPDLVKKIVERKQDPVQLKGSGEQTRSFVDLRDLVPALVRCMERPEAANEAFNLGTTREVSIRQLATIIWQLSDRTGEITVETSEPFERDVKRRVPDITKAQEQLDWQPKYSLEETIQHYLDNYAE
jgi:nucleoside-diphosphate-sugar epimerase